MRRLTIAIGTAALTLAALVIPSTSAGATATTFHVTTGECSGAGSILEAVAAANANPGDDTIIIDVPEIHFFKPIAAGYVCAPVNGDAAPVLSITDSVTINGQGVEISATPIFLDQNGFVNDVQGGRCPGDSNDRLVEAPVSFAEIGTYGQDNSGIHVTFADMTVTKMSGLAKVRSNASLTIQAVTASNITDLSDHCDNPAILAEAGANLTITDSWFKDSVMAATDLYGINSFIFGGDAGDLTIRTSLFTDIDNMQSVYWSAPSTSKVAIVSSQFLGAGGMTVIGKGPGTLDAFLTNSIMRLGSSSSPGRSSSSNAIIANGSNGLSALHVQSSTILANETECHPSSSIGNCLRPAAGTIIAASGSSIDLTHSAVGVGWADSAENNLPLFAVTAGGTITGDQYSWAQPTNTQNAAAISAIVGNNVVTTAPGLYAGGFYPGDAAFTPLVVFGGTPGVLIDAIPNTQGTQPTPGVNVLRDPLTNDPILTDVWGNPRWDGNDASNIGAIQTTLAPYLVVSGVGDTTVDLTWSQVAPANPAYPVDKFVVSYRAVGSSGPWSTLDVTDPSHCYATVTGLTNGVNYEFVVHAHAPSPVGDMPDSNIVAAMPLGPVGAPQPTAQGGPAQIELFWTDPPTGGHPGPLSYYVMFRPVGTSEWSNGPGPITGRVTIIPELLPGTQYELAVFALTADGATSVQVGTTFAATDADPTTTTGGEGPVTPAFTG